MSIKYRFIKQKSLSQQKLDGVYHSYWLGKFLNMFIKQGKKKKVFKHLYTCLLLVKIENKMSPVLYFFEIIERIKPSFKLVSYFPTRTALITPKVVPPSSLYKVVLQWIRVLVNADYVNARKSRTPYYKIVHNSLQYLYKTKNHTLIKKRDQYLVDAIRLQRYLRYTWPKEDRNEE